MYVPSVNPDPSTRKTFQTNGETTTDLAKSLCITCICDDVCGAFIADAMASSNIFLVIGWLGLADEVDGPVPEGPAG